MAATRPTPTLPAAERLLATADQLFYAEGIRAVGIDRLLAESGVAKASLYQHYGSKDALVAAYLQARVDRWHGFLDDALPDVDDDPERRLLVVFDLIAAWMTEPGFRGCPFINAGAELPDPDHPGRSVIAEHRVRNLARFRELATAMHVDDPGALASTLVLLYDGALVAADLGPADAAATALVEGVRRVVAGSPRSARGGRSSTRTRRPST